MINGCLPGVVVLDIALHRGAEAVVMLQSHPLRLGIAPLSSSSLRFVGHVVLRRWSWPCILWGRRGWTLVPRDKGWRGHPRSVYDGSCRCWVFGRCLLYNRRRGGHGIFALGQLGGDGLRHDNHGMARWEVHDFGCLVASVTVDAGANEENEVNDTVGRASAIDGLGGIQSVGRAAETYQRSTMSTASPHIRLWR